MLVFSHIVFKFNENGSLFFFNDKKYLSLCYLVAVSCQSKVMTSSLLAKFNLKKYVKMLSKIYFNESIMCTFTVRYAQLICNNCWRD